MDKDTKEQFKKHNKRSEIKLDAIHQLLDVRVRVEALEKQVAEIQAKQ